MYSIAPSGISNQGTLAVYLQHSKAFLHPLSTLQLRLSSKYLMDCGAWSEANLTYKISLGSMPSQVIVVMSKFHSLSKDLILLVGIPSTHANNSQTWHTSSALECLISINNCVCLVAFLRSLKLQNSISSRTTRSQRVWTSYKIYTVACYIFPCSSVQ
jgi:hypothetical protein